MKILIVDDNERMTTMISKMLSIDGHECIISKNGRNGLSLLENQKFDATILDLAMPEFSGYDIIDALEKNGKIKDQKIIVLTASVTADEQLEQMKKQGVHSILKKPVDPDVLLEVLKS